MKGVHLRNTRTKKTYKTCPSIHPLTYDKSQWTHFHFDPWIFVTHSSCCHKNIIIVIVVIIIIIIDLKKVYQLSCPIIVNTHFIRSMIQYVTSGCHFTLGWVWQKNQIYMNKAKEPQVENIYMHCYSVDKHTIALLIITSSPFPPGTSSAKISLKFFATPLKVRSMDSSFWRSKWCTSCRTLASPIEHDLLPLQCQAHQISLL